jgi:FAD/FMN-containing dehydrogenase
MGFSPKPPYHRPVNRRTFLRRIGAVSVAGPFAALLASCTRAASRTATVGSPVPTSGGTASPTGRPPLRWDDLATTLRGDLIRPGTPRYPIERLDYNPRFDAIHPRAIVIAASAGDVSKTILFARDHRLGFAARSGGHSYGGYSLSDGIVIDLSRLSSVRPDPGGQTATVGAGASVIGVAAALAPTGAVVPVGTCPTVGMGGLTLGGGQGVVGRRFGLTCDSLRSATVVLADGSVVRCDEQTNADLFWGLRGAGGGNLGVVTSFTFATHPLAKVTAFSMVWPWSSAADVVAAWQEWGPGAPAALWSSCRLRWIPGTGPVVSVSGAWSGAPSALGAQLDELAAAANGAASRSTVTLSPLDAARYFAGCSGSSIDECRLAIRGGTLTREGSIAKSDFFDGPISPGVVDSILGWVEDRGSSPVLAANTAGALFDAWGGAIADLRSDETAFPHRRARFLAQEFVTFAGSLAADELASERRWLASLWRAFRPAASGFAYVNYIDPDLEDWLHAYYGSNLARLVDVKRRYDPDDVFRFAQSIPTSLP